MKNLLWVLIPAILFSCKHTDDKIVDQVFADSLVNHYTSPATEVAANGNLLFWKKRLDSIPDNFVNAPEYASALVSSFRLHGSIADLLKADSLYAKANEANQGKEPGIFRTMASLAMLQHQFIRTDQFLKKALEIEGLSMPNAFLEFDLAFERGEYQRAKKLLPSLKAANEYGYLFRKAKYEHYSGSLDTAIDCMVKAAQKMDGNIYLQQAAYSNAADLYIHKGDLQSAYDLYKKSLLISPTDMHSMTGLGWIALVHDKNDSLAERIFKFVQLHSQAPDILLKLEQLEEARGNTAMQKQYAEAFAKKAGDSVYGRMYSKYLIDLYTSILAQPAKAVELSAAELNNRPTAQIYAWYAWSLYCNNEKDKAYTIYKGQVSGKPLEGPELYYMGKLMQGLDKGYNARQFFKAADKNRYDLSPGQQRDLAKNLE
ncbi:MAG: hypothetical protein ABI480_18085 [Chitinophagaceae bacterium]